MGLQADAQPLVEHFETHVLVLGPLRPSVGGGNPSREPLRESSIPAPGLERDRPYLVHAQFRLWVVPLHGDPLDPTLALVEARVLAPLPRADRLVGDVRLVADDPQPLQRAQGHDPPSNRGVPQSPQASLAEGEPQVSGTARGELHDTFPRMVIELATVPRVPTGLKHREAVVVRQVDEGPNVPPGHPRELGDLLDGEALGRGEDHLSPFHLDRVVRPTEDALEVVAFVVRYLADPEDHAQGGSAPRH